jgi:hypothetical protein
VSGADGADADAAAQWAITLPAGSTRAAVLARIGYALASEDPRAAADFVVRHGPPGETQSEAAIAVLHLWALRNRGAAREWVNAFPPGALRERAMNELAAMERSSAGVRGK